MRVRWKVVGEEMENWEDGFLSLWSGKLFVLHLFISFRRISFAENKIKIHKPQFTCCFASVSMGSVRDKRKNTEKNKDVSM